MNSSAFHTNDVAGTGVSSWRMRPSSCNSWRRSRRMSRSCEKFIADVVTEISRFSPVFTGEKWSDFWMRKKSSYEAVTVNDLDGGVYKWGCQHCQIDQSFRAPRLKCHKKAYLPSFGGELWLGKSMPAMFCVWEHPNGDRSSKVLCCHARSIPSLPPRGTTDQF